MSTDECKKPNKLSKYLRAPIKILILAKDFCMNSLSLISDHLGYGTAVGCPTVQAINTLPRSLSLTNTSPSYTPTSPHLNKKSELEQLRRQQSQKDGGVGKGYGTNISNNKMPRSLSVGIGRIDEDSPYDLQNDPVKNDALPRSRSHASLKRSFSRVFHSSKNLKKGI